MTGNVVSSTPETGDADGLICAYLLDGAGGGRALDWAGVRAWKPEDGMLWVHLDRKLDAAQHWLRAESGVNAALASSLLADDARPRVLPDYNNLLVVLRGVNLNPEADPEDMVSVRTWFEPHRIITLRHMRVMAINDIRERVAAGKGPASMGGFLVQLTDRLVERMGPVVDDISAQVDDLEEDVAAKISPDLRFRLNDTRRAAIMLRRHLAPQRDAMSRLLQEKVDWISDHDRAVLREIADRTTRYVEDLETIRERIAVVLDELNFQMSDRMNRTMYVLTVVAAILLPPSLIAGLLGINVGGMPGVESPLAFWIVVVIVLALGVFEYFVLRKLKWI